MLRRIAIALTTIFAAASLFAQEPTAADLEKRVRELEAKLAQVQAAQPSTDLTEVRRQIEVLTQEIEALKTRQTDKAPTADTEQHGLGAAASKVYRSEPGVSFGGYGELLYQNLAGTNDAGTRVSTKDSADALRAIIYSGYKFNDKVLFNSEIEFEHANTERGGVVEVEFAYLDYLVRPSLGIRTGLVLVPMGFINEQHEPTAFLGVRRPLVERSIIPATWREIGVGVFGEVGQLSYRGYVMTSLDASRFTASGIRGGRGSGAQQAAEDFAVVGRLDWQPVIGSTIGGSLYTGNSGQATLVNNSQLQARVTLWDIHAETEIRGLQLRGLFARGTIDDAAGINAMNKLTGSNSVGESNGGWYAEAGYDLAALRGFAERSLTPFVRYEKFNTQRSVPTGFSKNPAQDQSVTTFGVQWKPISQTVIKADYQNVDNEAGTGVNQWNVGIGYIF